MEWPGRCDGPLSSYLARRFELRISRLRLTRTELSIIMMTRMPVTVSPGHGRQCTFMTSFLLSVLSIASAASLNICQWNVTLPTVTTRESDDPSRSTTTENLKSSWIF